MAVLLNLSATIRALPYAWLAFGLSVPLRTSDGLLLEPLRELNVMPPLLGIW